MLFDPKWDKPHLDGFIGWLETKDPNERYNWWDYNKCAAAQYSKAIGHLKKKANDLCGWQRDMEEISLLSHPGGTFGYALARAKAAANADA